MFNTLKYAKILEEFGFSREQAETAIKILAEIMEDKLASKQDLKELEARLSAKLESSLTLLESKLTIKMGTMLAASIAILTAVQKFISS